MTLLDDFRHQLSTLHLPAGRALVAVSGGPDSVALLDLLHRTHELHQLDLVVAHFDHGIHPASARVAEAVRLLAGSYRLAYEEGRGELGAAAGETLARASRYAWLEATRARLGAALVFTAHHADDQVETVLMRALRGSGPAGLAGMAAAPGHAGTPTAPVPARSVLEYARARALPVWSRSCQPGPPTSPRAGSAADVLPLLRTRLPAVDDGVARASDGRPPATAPPGTRCSTCCRAWIFGGSAMGFPLLPVRSAGMIQPWERPS